MEMALLLELGKDTSFTSGSAVHLKKIREKSENEIDEPRAWRLRSVGIYGILGTFARSQKSYPVHDLCMQNLGSSCQPSQSARRVIPAICMSALYYGADVRVENQAPKQKIQWNVDNFFDVSISANLIDASGKFGIGGPITSTRRRDFLLEPLKAIMMTAQKSCTHFEKLANTSIADQFEYRIAMTSLLPTGKIEK
jgi:hypothetical protein